MTRIVVTDSTFSDLRHERAVAERHGATLDSFQCSSEREVVEAVADAAAVFVQFAPMRQNALAVLAPGAPVVRYGVGFDNIDVAAARRLGHPVTYVPDYCIDEVADHTVAMFLSLYRKLATLDASIRAGAWAALAHARPLKPAGETSVGFLGLGRIGHAVLERLKPFNFKLIVCDPALDMSGAAGLGVALVSFEELIACADALLLHAPLTAALHHVINSEVLGRLQPGAVLVNCARGALVDEAALVDALHSGRLAAAALDVFEREPLPSDSPLRAAPNLLVTPHAAWYSESALNKLQCLAADEIDRALNGRPPRCPVP